MQQKNKSTYKCPVTSQVKTGADVNNKQSMNQSINQV